MRIIAGRFRGRELAGVGRGDIAGRLRPTSDRVRESVFNLLSGGRFGDPLAGVHVLDLFAGTGALGLEALSRGAATAVFVENGTVAAGLIARNIALCGAEASCRIIRREAARLGPNPGPACALVFLDPPYGRGLGGPALAAARAGGWIAPEALVVWEEAAEPAPPAGFALLESRRYGGTVVTLMRADAAGG